MTNFENSFEKMIRREGGYTDHTVAGDHGGRTYAGISSRAHPEWQGWAVLNNDPDNPQLAELVYSFYKANYWDRIKGDEIQAPEVAESIFDFSVNAGVRTAAKLAQLVVGATPDGVIGDKSIASINAYQPDEFVTRYALTKVKRYAEICRRDPAQKKFLLGWINRTLDAVV